VSSPAGCPEKRQARGSPLSRAAAFGIRALGLLLRFRRGPEVIPPEDKRLAAQGLQFSGPLATAAQNCLARSCQCEGSPQTDAL